jgi:hypothetical protein
LRFYGWVISRGQTLKEQKELIMANATVAYAEPTELNAATVAQLIQQTYIEATETYPFTVWIRKDTITENAVIGWQLKPNYAIGLSDTVQLRVNALPMRSWDIKREGISGERTTDLRFEAGMTVAYAAWNYGNASGWRDLVVTRPTA